MVEIEIRGLYSEMDRVKKRYETSRKGINEKIKYMERELEKVDT